jgi:transcriptional regulator GlxA family with amidase domain
MINLVPRRVVFLLLPKVHVLDMAGPAQAFYSAADFGAAYKLLFCAGAAETPSAQGLVFKTATELPTLGPDDLVVIPGQRASQIDLNRPLPAKIRTWLQETYQAGTRLASVCSGAFALGEAGFLDGRRCTTHWSLTDELQRRYPEARVATTALYVHDGEITTSAGIASGIDMALSLIEMHYGPGLTAKVARDLVVFLRRHGGHEQTSIYLSFRDHLHPGVHRVQEWLSTHFAEPVRLPRLAKLASMSSRNLIRVFKTTTGLTPLQYQQRLRLEFAGSLLRDSRLTLDSIAESCGFADPRHFRRLWKSTFHASPSEARKQDAQKAGGPQTTVTAFSGEHKGGVQ